MPRGRSCDTQDASIGRRQIDTLPGRQPNRRRPQPTSPGQRGQNPTGLRKKRALAAIQIVEVMAEWGRILAWEPPDRLVCSWYPGHNPDTAQELEVAFQDDAHGTRVTLTHIGWERLGDERMASRTGYDEGWDIVLQPYIELAAAG
jgi:Activator of Hsp90 ATPase homolog 1-like protein